MGNASGGVATPVATGTLAERPLSHLLIYARNKRLTGRLMLQAHDGLGGAIALWRGRIAASRTWPATTYFGDLACEMGLVNAAIADAAYQGAVETKRLHGEILIEHGRLSAEQRDTVLVEQNCRKVHHLLGLAPTTTFAFYETTPSAAEPAGAIDAVTPLWRAIRDGAFAHEAAVVLGALVTGGVRVVNEAPVARAGFSADEHRLCEILAARAMTLGQVHAAFANIRPERIDRLVYLLLLTKAAETAVVAEATVLRRGGSMDADTLAEALKASRRPPPAAGASPSSPPVTSILRNSIAPSIPDRPSGRPAGVSGTQRAISTSSKPSATAASDRPAATPAQLGAEAITSRAAAVEDESPFDTLGVPANAPADAARAAYFQLVKTWHPDRLPAELTAVRDDVGKIFSQMTKAHQTLTDVEARRAYVAAQEARAAAMHRPRAVAIRLIETALAKKDFDFAADESRKLAAANAQDAEALALVVWSTSSAGEGAEASARAALTALDHAIRSDADCARAFHYRAMLHKRLGNAAFAHRDFARAVALDPKNVDATRELRIYEMRMKR